MDCHFSSLVKPVCTSGLELCESIAPHLSLTRKEPCSNSLFLEAVDPFIYCRSIYLFYQILCF